MAETIISPGVFTRENDISFIQPAPVEAGAAIIGPAVKGPVEIPTIVTSYNDYTRKFGATFESGSDSHEFLTSIAVKSFFEQGGNTCLVTRVVSGSYTTADSTFISSSFTSSLGAAQQPFVLETLGKGAIYNSVANSVYSVATDENSDGSLVNGSSDNLRWEISNVNSGSGEFTLSIRRGDDNTKSKIILETFNNLSLDPNSDRFIARAIGDQALTKRVDGGGNIYFDVTGSYVNKSNFVRVKSVNLQTLNFYTNDGVTVRNTDFIKYVPIAQVGGFHSAAGTVKGGANLFKDIDTQTQGLVAANYADAISILSNTDEFLFNILSAPGITKDKHSATVDALVSLVESRGDAIAVIDLHSYGATVTDVTGQAAVINSSYAASYWPWLQTQSATGKNVWVPASVVIPGIYAFTDGSSAPWFAPAGLVRGGVPGVIQAERKLTRADRDTLYNGKVNPIATFPGTGIAVYGQKTLQTKASALDRVNVRRLLLDLKKFIGDQAQNLVFEQNTISTRNRFLATVNPYLDSVTQRNGLYAYRVVMDDTNNSADVIDRNQLVGQIYIQPAKTAEFIVLDFVVEPTGATFGA